MEISIARKSFLIAVLTVALFAAAVGFILNNMVIRWPYQHSLRQCLDDAGQNEWLRAQCVKRYK